MNFSLSPEQQSLQKAMIAFAKKELNQHIDSIGKAPVPAALWKRCAEMGLTGACIDKTWGGNGLDTLSTMALLEAIGYGCEDGGLNFSLCAQLLASTIPLHQFGTETQKKKYLPGICNGSLRTANAITEAGAGSDISAMQTTAEESGGHYVINGSKKYISNAADADMIIVFAVTDRSKGFFGGLTAFMIDSKAEGVSIGPDMEKMGLNSCRMNEITLTNVKTGKEDMLGGLGGGTAIFGFSMDWERAGIAVCHTGAMQALLERCIHHAGNTGKDEALIKKQAVSHRIADMKVQVEAARLLAYKAVKSIGTDRNSPLHCSIAKLFVSEAYVKMASEAVQLHGAAGYTKENGIERILRDATAATIYSGTSDIQRNIISGWKNA